MSIAINVILLGKAALIDPNIAFRPTCQTRDGGVYVEGTTNERFRDVATHPSLAIWTRFGFRRTEEQVYISLYDYITMGDMNDDFLNLMNGMFSAIEADQRENLLDNPIYLEWRQATEAQLAEWGLEFGQVKMYFGCEMVELLAMEKRE